MQRNSVDGDQVVSKATSIALNSPVHASLLSAAEQTDLVVKRGPNFDGASDSGPEFCLVWSLDAGRNEDNNPHPREDKVLSNRTTAEDGVP